jgi:hypothetical protein
MPMLPWRKSSSSAMAAVTLAWSSTKRLSLPSMSPVSARTALAGTGRPRNELLMSTGTA